MKSWIFMLLLSLLTACAPSEGKLQVASDREGLTLSVDGTRQGAIGKTPILLTLSAGQHKLVVEGESDDGEWRYEGGQTVTISAGQTNMTIVTTRTSPSARRTARLEQQARARREAAQGWASEHAAEIQTIEADMVAIPGGRFVMGSQESELGHTRYEAPAHTVTVAPFAMAKHETTFAQYDLFCAATGRHPPADEGWGRGMRPVVNVSWVEATAYAQWLSDVTGHDYRLPSEAQWEYAYRGGTTTPYYWGAAMQEGQANHGSEGPRQTLPVGSFPPNPLGLYDMAGNAAEWCADLFHRGYKGAPSDDTPWEVGGAGRVVKGGSWFDFPMSLRAAARIVGGEEGVSNLIGFRVVRVGG
ncbi:MAG: hypothetical protein COX57_10035 [Alphaproteobacteria bacterium CG_4_10_14_0_2_um_filter_63_37]|nr:MAG: hypothetical protein AUJ55_04060 [Proteobacteria bacterium CG1_02_64_396]PJA24121.1 MAG: hypothetical protein COX57_10035 [Alphaproteobacteria bacterium CG_4_10_14_0_2_um_filter_63_37]